MTSNQRVCRRHVLAGSLWTVPRSAPVRVAPLVLASLVHFMIWAPTGCSSRDTSANANTALTIVPPHNGFRLDESDLRASNLIERRHFVEEKKRRCLASTVVNNASLVEPTFVVVSEQGGEVFVAATASPRSVLEAGFDPRKPTTIVLHGFRESYRSAGWLHKITHLYRENNLLRRQNLIFMDWSRVAFEWYQRVAAQASVMGSFLANFIWKLIELGADRLGIRLIGFSVSTHIAGFAGKRIRPPIGRIVAFDPASFGFGRLFSAPPTQRLDKDDAVEVDVYHYNDGFLGLPGQIGQMDIVVNGGSVQPGADGNLRALVKATLTTMVGRKVKLAVSHSRSVQVATAQLAPIECQLVAYECDDYPSFKAGECATCQNDQCRLVSLDFQFDHGARPSKRVDLPPPRRLNRPQRLYVETIADKPFCVQHYQVLVTFEQSAALDDKDLSLQLELRDAAGQEVSLFMDHRAAGTRNKFSHLLLHDAPKPTLFSWARLRVRTAKGSWTLLAEANNNNSNNNNSGATRLPGNGRASWLRPQRIDINYMSNIDPRRRQALSSRLCPAPAAAHSKKPPPDRPNEPRAGHLKGVLVECSPGAL